MSNMSKVWSSSEAVPEARDQIPSSGFEPVVLQQLSHGPCCDVTCMIVYPTSTMSSYHHLIKFIIFFQLKGWKR